MSANSQLSSADRTKLAKLLGLLGSAHAGERDAAGLAAERLVRGAGLTWRQVLLDEIAERVLGRGAA